MALLAGTALLQAPISEVMAISSPQAPQAESNANSMLLVASRKLTHSGFRETVIVVTRHGRAGPIGLIVNRPMDISLDKVVPSTPGAEKLKLHEGGPVGRGQVSFMFRGGDMPADAFRIADQTYVARSNQLLQDLLGGKRAHEGLRVVAGYAGWAPGQLENEISRGDWLVLPFDGKAVFDLPAGEVWPLLYRRATQTTAQARPETGVR